MNRDRTEFVPERGSWTAAAVAVAVSAFYVLAFLRVGLPGLAPAEAAGTLPARQLAFFTAVGGALGSVLAAWRFRLVAYQRMLAWCFRAAAAVAALALMRPSPAVWLTLGFLSGVAAGWLAVVLVAGLRASVGTARLGSAIGTGMAVAVALADVGERSGMSPAARTILAALLAGSGSLTGPFLTPLEPSVSLLPHYRPRGFLRWLAALTAMTVLVAIAMFGVVDRGAGWWTWPAMAGGVAAALAAGGLMDRGRGVWVLAGAAGLLLLAVVVAAVGGLPDPARVLQLAGTVAGAVALVDFAARGARVTQVAWIFGVAGWVGWLVGTAFAANAPGSHVVGAAIAAAVAGAALPWRGPTARTA